MAYVKKKRYCHNDQNINDFGNSAMDILKDKYVEVPAYILSQLDEAVNFLQLAQDCRKQISEDGLTVINTKGVLSSHPLLTVMKEATTQFHRLCTALMLTENARDKARKSDHSDENRALEALLG